MRVCTSDDRRDNFLGSGIVRTVMIISCLSFIRQEASRQDRLDEFLGIDGGHKFIVDEKAGGDCERFIELWDLDGSAERHREGSDERAR